MQTWNHLACRRDAKAARHFCLSRTSGGSLTDSVSIHGWNKKTRYSLTKGFLSGGKGMWQLPKGQLRLPESQVLSTLDQGRRCLSTLNSAPRGDCKNQRPPPKKKKKKKKPKRKTKKTKRKTKTKWEGTLKGTIPWGRGTDRWTLSSNRWLPCFLSPGSPSK